MFGFLKKIFKSGGSGALTLESAKTPNEVRKDLGLGVPDVQNGNGIDPASIIMESDNIYDFLDEDGNLKVIK